MGVKLRLTLANVFFPLVIGLLIYIAFRDDSIKMFHWFDTLKLNQFISQIREVFHPFHNYLPNWFIYSFPDALWVYSLISSLFILWGKVFMSINIWLISALLIAPFHEFMQLFKLIPGTFDILDLSFYIVSALLSLYIINLKLQKNEKQYY